MCEDDRVFFMKPDDKWPPALLQVKAISWFPDMNFGKPNLHVGNGVDNKVGATLIPDWGTRVLGSFRMTKILSNGKLQNL